MGKRSRKRSAAPPARASEPEGPPPAAPPRRAPIPPRGRARLQDAPKAPWSPFPLVELTILLGIVLLALGFFGIADRRGLFLGCGVALVAVASLELTIREHFAGYRSHSTLLAGVAAAVALVPLYLLDLRPRLILLGVAVVVFAIAFALLRSAFRRRTGGIGFRA